LYHNCILACDCAELRNEESPDIVPFTNKRTVDKVVVKMGEELAALKAKLLSGKKN
jgi:ERCC4-related helicase